MISLPLLPKVAEKKGNWALFEIEGLYPGYGITLGNSIRRVLLSSLEGSAVTRVKIKGVQHEFSTIPGIMEDVINILLNVKQLRFKLYGQDPQTASLYVRGEKTVTGKDLKMPSQMELMNKEAEICTISSKSGEIEMEILVERGMGYEPVERRKKEKLAVGELSVDAIFTPVRKVSFRVENMRVGERTDFDKLILEVETDGSLSPEESLSMASKVLISHFELVSQVFKEEEPKKEKKGKGEEKKQEPSKIKVEELKISNRALKALVKNGIKTAGGIARKSEKSLLELEGMGGETVKEIKKALKKIGLEIKQSD
jgi:DNA-directed RNA polymerase subunit alpha